MAVLLGKPVEQIAIRASLAVSALPGRAACRKSAAWGRLVGIGDTGGASPDGCLVLAAAIRG